MVKSRCVKDFNYQTSHAVNTTYYTLWFILHVSKCKIDIDTLMQLLGESYIYWQSMCGVLIKAIKQITYPRYTGNRCLAICMNNIKYYRKTYELGAERKSCIAYVHTTRGRSIYGM